MRLKKYLQAEKISQIEFAQALGLTPDAISQYCSFRRTPSLKIIYKIRELTDGQVSYEDFINDGEDDNNNEGKDE